MSTNQYRLGMHGVSQQALIGVIDAFGLPTPVLIDLADATDTGSSNTDNITSNATPSLIIDFGTSPLTGDIIDFRDNGVVTASHTVTAPEAGVLSIPLGVTLTEGSNVLSVRHNRGALQSNWSPSLGVTLDTVAPTITTSATANCAENSLLAITLTANETVTWSLTGGADAAQFELSGTTLRWLSNLTKDYETPADVGTDNTYAVQVTATDVAGNVTNKTITVTVTDVVEGIALDWVSQSANSAGGTTHTTSALNLGVADVNRRILVGLGVRAAGAVNSVTITPTGDTAINMTAVPSSAIADLTNACSSWWYADVPARTTGVIVATFSASATRSKIEVYRVVSATGTPSTTPTPQKTSGGVSLSQAVTIPAGGAGAAMAFFATGNTNDITWTGAIKDDTSIQIGGFLTSGSAKVSTSGTVTTTITGISNTIALLTTAVWGP